MALGCIPASLFQLDAHLDELNTDEHSVVSLPTFDDTTQHDHDTWSAHIMDLTTVPFVRRYEHYNAGSFTDIGRDSLYIVGNERIV